MREMKCAVCGQISEFEDPIDFSKLEEGDLGGQPRFAKGDSYNKMVQCCPSCGYCNFNIAKNVLSAKDLLQSEEYKYILTTPDMDKRTAKMVAVAYIYECEGRYLISAKAHSYASRMFEQKEDMQRFQIFKEQEARLLLMYISSGYFKKHFDIKVYQHVIDAIRRLKKFEKAIKFCDVALTKTNVAGQQNIFMLEKSLCINKNSDPYEFPNANGEFENFYQILVQGFSGVQNEKTYKDTYQKMHSYLQKSAYFPIAEGADFIVRLDGTEFAGMDKMILELKKTYEKERGIIAETKEEGKKQAEAEKEEQPQPKPVQILTMESLNNQKEKQAEDVDKSYLDEYNKLKENYQYLQGQRESLAEEVSLLYQDSQEKEGELLKAKDELSQMEEENKIIAQQLEETIISRRELTADFDKAIYNLECEKQILKEKLEQLQKELESEKQKNSTQVAPFAMQENTDCEELQDEEQEELQEELQDISSQEDVATEIQSEENFKEENNEETPWETEVQTEATGDDSEENQENIQPSEDDFDDLFEADSSKYHHADFTEEEFEKEFLNEKFEDDFFEDDSNLQELIASADMFENQNSDEEEGDMAEFVLDELTEDMILNIAKIVGRIDVGEVQGMLQVGYKNAKYALDKIAEDGKLTEIDEDLYEFIEV